MAKKGALDLGFSVQGRQRLDLSMLAAPVKDACEGRLRGSQWTLQRSSAVSEELRLRGSQWTLQRGSAVPR